jgi:hypothetical protein
VILRTDLAGGAVLCCTTESLCALRGLFISPTNDGRRDEAREVSIAVMGAIVI